MANFSINNVALRGVSACVPKNMEENINYRHVSKEEILKFIEATGVKERRVATPNVCTSDLCYEAAKKLIVDLNWDKESIEIIIFVSQTADYILPITAAILQDRLGLPKEIIAFDIPLGCSGYVYGISSISSMMSAAGLKRGLLLVGDTISKFVSNKDKSTAPLFGDAGTATAFEFDTTAAPIFINLGTDGSGYKSIIMPDGGSRNKLTEASFESQIIDVGIERNNCQLALDGMDVFSFGISQAPKTVNALIDHFKIDKDKIDYYLFHQANKKMNKMIAKKLKLSDEKVTYSLEMFGNTSSASIPLTMVSEISQKLGSLHLSILMCGFGVGLSWGSIYLNTSNLTCPAIIEYE